MSGSGAPPELAARRALDSFDCSLVNLAELIVACLDAIEAGSVIEAGAEHGLLTAELARWAEHNEGARVTAIDPEPRPGLIEVCERSSRVALVRETSHVALRDQPLAHAIILDGDHNHFTVAGELRLISSRAEGAELPLLLLHDAGWPLARRDSYHAPEQIPEQHRRPFARDALLAPGETGLAARGLPFDCVAEREGGPANGVLTAIEDFTGQHPDLELALIPAFFGMAAVWHREAPWAAAVARTLAPWDRNAVLARMEASRIDHLVAEFANAADRDALRSRGHEREALLRAMLDSSAFAWAERASRLRQRGRPLFSREQVRDALGD